MFDFDYTGSTLHDEQFQHITLQVAFQYSQVVPVGSGVSQQGMGPSSTSSLKQQLTTSGGGSQEASSSSLGALATGQGRSFVVQRRLRIATIRCESLLFC